MKHTFQMNISEPQIRYLMKFYGVELTDKNIEKFKQNIIEYIESKIQR